MKSKKGKESIGKYERYSHNDFMKNIFLYFIAAMVILLGIISYLLTNPVEIGL